MKAPISVCLIVKNEEKNIERCLSSIRPYVDEIVVVDTGSTDKTPQIVKKYADKFQVYLECNDNEGNIASFSKARQKSFELASNKWVLWIDGDDEVVGADQLASIVEKYSEESLNKNICILFPYEYAHDNKGNVTCLHYRERLVCPAENFNWANPVHEVLIGPPDTINIMSEQVKMIHRRVDSGKPGDPFRNFRIIKKLVDEIGDSDPRQLYYLGLEYGNIGQVDNAIETLIRYVNLTGWDDEKCLAQLRIAQHYLDMNNQEESIKWATQAIHTKENWCEPYFHIGKSYYFLACVLESEGKNAARLWEKCINFIKMGLNLPPTQTVLFINPLERNVEIHRYLNFAFNKVGDIQNALTSVDIALQTYPDDNSLLMNKKAYQNELSKKAIMAEATKLESSGELNSLQKEAIHSLVGGANTTIQAPFNEKSNIILSNTENWRNYHRPEGYPRNVQDSDFPVAQITPHPQAWGIPESYVYDDLPLKMTDGQLQAMIVALYKEYMFHDEVLSAISLLENAPYRIRHNNDTTTILNRAKKFIEWINDPVEYDKGNSTLDFSGNLCHTDMTPLTAQLGGQAYARFIWLTDRMKDKNKSILDMACIDGQMTNRWGLVGYKDITGVDCCTNSIKIANEKAIEFKTGAKHVLSYFDKAPELFGDKKFDYITCGDVYEHLLNPVKDLLIPARQMVSDNGKMLLVTPHGAWFRGQFVKHAHPWLWANEGKHWLSEMNRGHVIAPTVWTVAKHFTESGWWVKNCTAVAQWYQDVPDQGNVCVEALPHPPAGYENGKDVVIFLGNGYEDWTPHTVDIEGIGGSELAAINMSKQLVQMGHKVKIYSSCGKWGEGIYDGVEYYYSSKFHDLKCDVLIVSRYAPALDPVLNIQAKAKLLWVHDVVPKGLTHELSLQADKILALSEWHKNNILNAYPFIDPQQVVVTRNGIDLTRFDINVERKPNKVVYSSSPDRGLPVLLKIWPQIKKIVPNAELHIFYGFKNWKESAMGDQSQMNFIDQLIDQMNSLKSLDVNYHNRVNQNILAKEYKSAGVWAYPTWFCCHPDTQISIPGDHRNGPPTVKISDLEGKTNFPVYAFDEKENKFKIATCKKVWKTKMAEELVEIKLDSGSTLKLTPDHLVLTFDGDWVEAGSLKENDSLRALHYRYNVAIKDGNGRWTNEHRLVGEWKIGRPLTKDEHVDHNDLQRLDNRPESLTVMSAREHISKTHRGKKQSRKHEEKRMTGWKKYWETLSDEQKSELGRARGKKTWKKINNLSKEEFDIFIANRSQKRKDVLQEKMKDPEYAAQMSETASINGKKGADKRWGKNHKVVSIKKIPGCEVYDMEVEKYHNFIAEGVVVHNCETSCITAMEAHAAGLSIVTSPIAALNETVGPRGVLIPGDWLSDEYQEQFIKSVVNALLFTTEKKRKEMEEYAKENFGWEGVAQQWDQLFTELLDQEINIVPYKGKQ